MFAKDAYLGVCRGRGVLEDWSVHEDGTLITVNIIQKGRERLVQAAVAADVTVAGRLGRHPEGHPALGCIADRTLLAAHTVAAAAQACSPDDQRKLQDQLLASGNVDVNL